MRLAKEKKTAYFSPQSQRLRVESLKLAQNSNFIRIPAHLMTGKMKSGPT